MGYYSDVLLAVAFDTKEQLEEVWAVYCLNPKVQEYNLAEAWEKKLDGDYPVLWYYANGVKWYDSYEDVRAFEALFPLAETFKTERGDAFDYASLKLRLGEEEDDNEHRANYSKDELVGYLEETAGIRRYIEHSF